MGAVRFDLWEGQYALISEIQAWQNSTGDASKYEMSNDTVPEGSSIQI